MGMMTRRNVKQRAVVKTAPVIEKIQNDDFSKHMNAPVEKTEAEYTKTEINRMPIVELKELAIANGIKVDEDTTGSQLKKLLIEKFEL